MTMQGVHTMIDQRDIEIWLSEMGDDTVPLGDGFRASLIAAAPAPKASIAWWRRIGISGWSGALGVPLAALCGVWLGIAQPALVLQAVPGMEVSTSDTVSDGLYDDIYGSNWEEWL